MRRRFSAGRPGVALIRRLNLPKLHYKKGRPKGRPSLFTLLPSYWKRKESEQLPPEPLLVEML